MKTPMEMAQEAFRKNDPTTCYALVGGNRVCLKKKPCPQHKDG